MDFAECITFNCNNMTKNRVPLETTDGQQDDYPICLECEEAMGRLEEFDGILETVKAFDSKGGKE